MELLQPAVVGMLIVWPYLRLARTDKWEQLVDAAHLWGAMVFLTWMGIVKSVVDTNPTLLVAIPVIMWIVGAIIAKGIRAAYVLNKTSRR